MDLRFVTDQLSVAPQIQPGEVPELASAGFVTVINNRPEGESPISRSGAEVEAACRKAGLAYHAIPIRGAPTEEQARAQRDAAAGGKTLAFCRSGTRSINTWALGEALAGARSAEDLERLGRSAGYDLSWIRAVA